MVERFSLHAIGMQRKALVQAAREARSALHADGMQALVAPEAPEC
jgi:hypothetical protein